MIQIYYGLGKGKTSALNGAALRSYGAGLRVGIFRFLKGRVTSEDAVLNKVGIPVKSFHHGTKFVIEMNKEEKFKARDAIKFGLSFIILNQHKFDVIILDEFLDLADPTVAFFNENSLIEFIDKINPEKELLISGHKKYVHIFDKADLISYIKPEKHYFDSGVKSRKGFEY